ncbi:MAG: tyrosine-type recombinase/integrase [Clostridia bacterium]|nr:tyrosine-type recombinase/integrase [Clostridia bacterium]
MLKQYLDYLKNETELSGNTINSYRYDIEGFMETLKKSPDEMFFTQSDILSYMLHMKDSGKSAATILRCVAAVKNYSKYLEQQGYIDENPCEGIELPQRIRREPKRLASSEIVRLLNVIKKESMKGMRDYAMICLVAKCGIQASEMTALDISDFIVKDRVIVVNKNGRERIYPLSDEVSDAIVQYISKCRPLIVIENESALFVNTNGRRMTRQGFWKIVRQYKEKASIGVNVTPRTLRYSLHG